MAGTLSRNSQPNLPIDGFTFRIYYEILQGRDTTSFWSGCVPFLYGPTVTHIARYLPITRWNVVHKARFTPRRLFPAVILKIVVVDTYRLPPCHFKLLETVVAHVIFMCTVAWIWKQNIGHNDHVHHFLNRGVKVFGQKVNGFYELFRFQSHFLGKNGLFDTHHPRKVFHHK